MLGNPTKPITLVIHWSSFGPYHLARLSAAYRDLKPVGIEVVGMETASQMETYPWRRDNNPTNFKRFVVLPGQIYERASPVIMSYRTMVTLNYINPHIIAISGYSTYDARSALIWSKLRHRPAILMYATKRDFALRIGWKEWVKRGVIRQFSSALCGGTSHRTYLEQLGMKPERIHDGIDVVDNDFFWRGAVQARQNPTEYRSWPGLESPEPFFLACARFVKLKNQDGLLRAYGLYRQRLAETDQSLIPWRLVVLGNGAERSALEQLVYSEGIQGVSFVGFRQIDELPIYYGLASVFIHPAHQEQWGLVVNEAMAAGLPVLVSNVCGCASDLVHEKVNGYTFASEDLATMVDLMVRVSTGKEDLQAMGQASLDYISEWGLKHFTQGLYRAAQVALNCRKDGLSL